MNAITHSVLCFFLLAFAPLVHGNEPNAAAPDTQADGPPEPELAFDTPRILAEGAGLKLVRQRWQLGEESGLAWRVSMPLDGSVRVVPSPRVEQFSQLLPSDEGPWAAINGGFYTPDGKPMGVVIADGVLHSPFHRVGGSGVLQVSERGTEIVHHSAFSPNVVQALQSIDRIVDGGRSLVNFRPDAPQAARSGVVVKEGEVVLVLVAGEQSIVGQGDDIQLQLGSAYGMPLWAFSRYLIEAVGARSALNLDGGVSSQLAVQIGGRSIHVRAPRGTVNAVVLRPN